MTGLFDWFFTPVKAEPGAGINNLGLIGATLKDVGSQLNGGEASALESFQTRARRLGERVPPERDSHDVKSSRPLSARDIRPIGLEQRIRALVKSLP